MREPRSNNSFGERQKEPGAEGGREGAGGRTGVAMVARDERGKRNARGFRACVCVCVCVVARGHKNYYQRTQLEASKNSPKARLINPRDRGVFAESSGETPCTVCAVTRGAAGAAGES